MINRIFFARLISALFGIRLINSTLALFQDDAYDNTKIKEWMVFPDGSGNLHNFSLHPSLFNAVNTDFVFEFRLYTRNNMLHYQPLSTENTLNSFFNPLVKTIFIVHGWQADSYTPYILDIKDAFLEKWDVNVITVDWGQVAGLLYPLARLYAKDVAFEMTNFKKHLVNAFKYPYDLMYGVGFSLGAHIIGLSAKKDDGGKMRGIIALDPALPLFSIKYPGNRLDKSDAICVQVIHTSAGSLGFKQPIGHLDFYPNGGKAQPGCGPDIFGACAHTKAITYFLESFKNPNRFQAIKCSSYEELFTGFCPDLGIYYQMGDFEVSPEHNGIYWIHMEL